MNEESFEAEGGEVVVARGLSMVGTVMVESCEAEGKPEVEMEGIEKEESFDAEGMLAVGSGSLTGGVQAVTEESCEAAETLVWVLAGVTKVVGVLVVSISKVVLRGLRGELSLVMVVLLPEDGRSMVMLRALGMEGEGREESWEARGISMVVFSGLAGEATGIIQPFPVSCLSCCSGVAGTALPRS